VPDKWYTAERGLEIPLPNPEDRFL
jgi:hypothetical protein